MPFKREAPRVSDAEIIEAIAAGDEASFSALYDRYQSPIYGLLLRMVPSRPEAEDLLQEVFLQVWRQSARYQESRGRPFTWLVIMARSRAIDYHRSAGASKRSVGNTVQEEKESVADAVRDFLLSEQRSLVRRALDELPEGQRRVLLLAYFSGLTRSEIARLTGEHISTVKSRMRAGIIRLRRLLHDSPTGS